MSLKLYQSHIKLRHQKSTYTLHGHYCGSLIAPNQLYLRGLMNFGFPKSLHTESSADSERIEQTDSQTEVRCRRAITTPLDVLPPECFCVRRSGSLKIGGIA